MVRVSGVAATASSWTEKTRNFVSRRLSAFSTFYFRHSHRDAAYHLPQRSRFRGRRRSRTLSSFTVMALVMVVTFAILQWYLLSFMVTDENNNADSKPMVDKQNYDPLWNECPVDRNEIYSPVATIDDDICFLTCIFGDTIETVDRPANVEWFDKYWCHTRFLLVTNLADLPAPGWTKFVSNTTELEAALSNDNTEKRDGNNNTMTQQQKNIVMSRHAKFLAWEALPKVVPRDCAAVVYMDGYLAPMRYQSWWDFIWAFFYPPWSPASPLFLGLPWKTQIPPPRKFQNIVQQVRHHPWGLSQVLQKYFNGLRMDTLLNNLVRDRKDTKEHVDKTLQWLYSKSDEGSFQAVVPYYLNKYFAYDPNNLKYRELSSSFWKTYTTYGGTWRDQPLWAYFLNHFNVTPAVMTTEGTITKGGDLFQTRGELGWGKHVYT